MEGDCRVLTRITPYAATGPLISLSSGQSDGLRGPSLLFWPAGDEGDPYNVCIVTATQE